MSGIKKLPLIQTLFKFSIWLILKLKFFFGGSFSAWYSWAILDMDLDRSRVCRRVTKVHQSHRGGARVRVCVRGHWGRAAWLRQSCGSGSGQRELHVRLSVAPLHFVFSFFQHCGLKMKCLWKFCIDTLASFILRYYLKLLYKFTLNLILVFNRQ